MTQLSPRQMQTLALVAEGHTDAELAAVLHVSVPTVHRHLQDARAKLGARNRAHAVALAYRTGYLALIPREPDAAPHTEPIPASTTADILAIADGPARTDTTTDLEDA